ncbi:MAG: hypothetical protein PUC50_11225 [Bacteroidales bacterium]|nr:hypothetical protein [Bacteroidales bacterium]
MIQEIINFTKFIDTDMKDVIDDYLEPQQEGLFVEFSNDGSFIFEFYKEGNSISPLLRRCISRLRYSWTIEYDKKPFYQKCFDLPNKRIHSVSPFVVAIKRKYLEGGTEFDTKGVDLTYIQTYLNKAIAATKCSSNVDIEATLFKDNLANNFTKLLSIIKEHKFTKENYVLFFSNTDINNYKSTYSNYLKTKIFNSSKLGLTDIQGKSVDEKKAATLNELRGWSNFFNGYNAGKPFLQHQTSLTPTNTISNTEATYLFLFKEYCRLDIFPNPLPIFVDLNEFNKDKIQSEIIRIYNSEEGRKLLYREIISNILSKPNTVLQKYYLLFRVGNDIKDFDFVPLFRYKFDTILNVENVTKDGVKKDKNFEPTPDKTIVNIFDFERIVVGSIFNGWLNSSTYFGEKPKSYKGSEDLWQMILTYRKAVYDYIYKSQTETLTCRMFDDMMYNSILLNIRSDEIKIRFEFHSSIKWKINIWFSLYNLFSNNNNNNIMASKVTELQAKMVAVAKGEANIETKEEFAFGAGQIVSYLIDRSAASNKTYALLEPYLQKSKSDQLQDAIAQTIAVYKHDISVYKGTFENLSSQVLTDDCNADMKPLLKYFLAGCFSPCAVYTKKDNSNN